MVNTTNTPKRATYPTGDYNIFFHFGSSTMLAAALNFHKVYNMVYDLNSNARSGTSKSAYILGVCMSIVQMTNTIIVASTDSKDPNKCTERPKSNTEMVAMALKSTDTEGKPSFTDSCTHLSAYSSLFCSL